MFGFAARVGKILKRHSHAMRGNRRLKMGVNKAGPVETQPCRATNGFGVIPVDAEPPAERGSIVCQSDSSISHHRNGVTGSPSCH